MQPNFATLTSTSNTTPSSNNLNNSNVNLVKAAVNNESPISTNTVDQANAIKVANSLSCSATATTISNSSQNFKTIKVTNLPSRSQSAYDLIYALVILLFF